MAEEKPSKLVTLVLVLVVIAAGITGGVLLYVFVNHRAPASTGLQVAVGDNVTVNYIGIFANGPQQGRVFDTSEYSVALNNVTWPKSLQYSSRGGKPSDYTPLGVYVGPNAPSSGYTIGNLTFGGVVTGFWQGLVGLPGNQTHYVTVPPALGYSYVNASCFVTNNLTNRYPVVVTLTPSEFSAVFPNVNLTGGTVYFTDPLYGWTDALLSANATAVVYENLPSLGMIVSPEGWAEKVTNITSTTITLTSQLSPDESGLVAGHSARTVCSKTAFIVTQINLGAGTYVADYNSEVNGQTLIFIVSVVDIFKPGTT
jgi:FKBP-type peptidyl-prolyl cis-trans isomerase 2